MSARPMYKPKPYLVVAKVKSHKVMWMTYRNPTLPGRFKCAWSPIFYQSKRHDLEELPELLAWVRDRSGFSVRLVSPGQIVTLSERAPFPLTMMV